MARESLRIPVRSAPGRYETFIDFEFGYVSGKTPILGVPVSRYLSRVVHVCDRIEDRLMRKSGRKVLHPRIPNQR
jgi:hypothetical protein